MLLRIAQSINSCVLLNKGLEQLNVPALGAELVMCKPVRFSITGKLSGLSSPAGTAPSIRM